MADLENTQALVLQQPVDQVIHLDLQHSTDWVVALSIVVSAVISFIGFLATIYIVRSSTKENIENNRLLVKSQKDIKDLEFKYLARSNLNNQLRDSYSLLLGTIDIYITEGLVLNRMIMKKIKDNDMDHLFEIRENLKNKLDELCLRVRSLVIKNQLYFNQLSEIKMRDELTEINSIMNEILGCNLKKIDAKHLFFKLSDQSLILKSSISKYLEEQKEGE